MNRCHLAAQCVFFSVREEGEELREYLTGLYCAGNFHDCARYRAALAMGLERVPDDIFPNEDAFISLFAWSIGREECPKATPGEPLPILAATGKGGARRSPALHTLKN